MFKDEQMEWGLKVDDSNFSLDRNKSLDELIGIVTVPGVQKK